MEEQRKSRGNPYRPSVGSDVSSTIDDDENVMLNFVYKKSSKVQASVKRNLLF